MEISVMKGVCQVLCKYGKATRKQLLNPAWIPQLLGTNVALITSQEKRGSKAIKYAFWGKCTELKISWELANAILHT